MQKEQIDLSIIVINLSTEKYKTRVYLEKLLKSIVPALKNVSYEFILVDNSTIDDGTNQLAKKYIKNLVYLKRSSIYSFCDNNNYGLMKANGKYVLFLNNDVEFIDNNILKELIEWMDQHPITAVTSCALLNADGKTIQPSGGNFPNLINVIAWMIFLNNSYHPANVFYYKEHFQDWVTGAFYLVRKSVLDKIGGFDIEYKAYVEEVDLSFRIKQLGFDIKYLPNWKIVHYGGQSYGNENSLISELKNIKLFFRKYYPSWHLSILNFTVKLGCLLRIIVFSVFRPNLVKVYAKAFKIV